MRDNRLALIITDEPHCFGDGLQQLGFTVEIIQNGRNALERLRDVEPALVVLDLQLSGFEILGTIRRESRLVSTRVVIITADVLCMHGLGMRVDGELMKPVRPDDLVEVIGQLFGPQIEVGH